jgi:aminoglycoside phosphotransferase (APT) family kinase protein
LLIEKRVAALQKALVPSPGMYVDEPYHRYRTVNSFQTEGEFISMESFNKSKLSQEELRRIIEKAFGQSFGKAAELTDGWANTAYAIQLADGRRVVLKVAPGRDKTVMRCERNNMQTEVETLRLVAERGGVPVPHVYVYDPTCRLIPAEYFIMEFVEGQPLNKVRDSLTQEQLAGIRYQLGVYNRRINDIKGSVYGPLFPEDGVRATWKEAFSDLIFGVLEDGRTAGVELPVTYEVLEEEINKRLPVMEEVSEANLVLWDLWDGNVFVRDGEVSAIIDLERSLWGDPLDEYYFSHFDRHAPFERGYGRSPATPSELQRLELYDLFRDLLMVIECYYRHYENKDHISWTHNNLRAGLERFFNKQQV